MFFGRYAALINLNPETFRFTMIAVKQRVDLPTFTEAEFDELIPTGVIASNVLHMPFDFPTRRLSWDQMAVYQRCYSLVTEIRRMDMLTYLPQPIQFNEELLLVDEAVPQIMVTN